MNNNLKNFCGGISGALVSFMGVTIEDADHIVSIVCGVLGLIITLVFTVIIPTVKSAKASDSEGGEEITKGEKIGIIRKIFAFLKDWFSKAKEKSAQKGEEEKKDAENRNEGE